MHEAACYALNCHPYKKIRTPNMGWIITAKPLKEGVEKDILPKLRGMVGSRDIVDIRPNNQGIPYKIIWRTGSVTYMMSAEQNDKVFEGTTVDWVAIDEPLRRQIYVAVMRGLQKSSGHWWWAMTPIDEPWIYDEIYRRGLDGGDKDIEVFEAEPDENVHIKKEDQDRFRRVLSEDEVQARIYGKFQHLAGRVIKKYNPEIHRVPCFDIPKHWPVWASTDPHRHKPHAVLFLAVAPTGVYYICNEIWLRCGIEELAGLSNELASQYTIIERLIDTSAQEEEHSSKITARKLLENAGWHTRLAQKRNNYSSGLILINELLDANRLFIMDHCVRTHREMMLHAYRKNKTDQAQILEEPEKKMNDMIANLRYILVENPDFYGPARIWEREAPYQRDMPKVDVSREHRSPYSIEHGTSNE